MFALLLIALPYLWNLRDPFLSDDYILVSHATLMPAFATPGGDGSYRPLGYLYFGLIHSFAGSNPLYWHLCSLTLHLLNCLLLYLLIRSSWKDEFLALGAALLFGVHATRPEVVVWAAGSFDLLSCTFTLAACVACGAGIRPALVTSLFVALAILCKESAYAAPIVLLVLCRVGLRPAILPSVTAASLLAYRFWLFHGPGGYIDPATGRPQILSLHFLPTAKALLLRIWTVLLVPVNWEARGPRWLIVAGLILSLGALLWSVVAAGKTGYPTRFLLLTAVSVLPAIHLALIGRSLLGSRILYLPSLGFCVFCAYLVRSRIALALLALGWTLLLLHNLGPWHRAAILAEQTCSAPNPPPTIPSTVEGVYFFANGFAECRTMLK